MPSVAHWVHFYVYLEFILKFIQMFNGRLWILVLASSAHFWQFFSTDVDQIPSKNTRITFKTASILLNNLGKKSRVALLFEFKWQSTITVLIFSWHLQLLINIVFLLFLPRPVPPWFTQARYIIHCFPFF